MTKKKREPGAGGIEDRHDEVRQLLQMGRERGYLAYDEISDLLPDEISSSPDDIEEVFSLFEANGIELVDAETK